MFSNRWCKILICFAVFSVPLVILSALYAGCPNVTPLSEPCPAHTTSTYCTSYGKAIACANRTYDVSNNGNWGYVSNGEDKTKVILASSPQVCWTSRSCKIDKDNGTCVQDADTNVDHNQTPWIEVSC